MAKTSSQQRALNAVKQFEAIGETVKNVTFLKGGEFKLEFTTDEDDNSYNSLDHIDFKMYKPEKKALEVLVRLSKID